ncbi:hypothetical protein EON64_20360, partial [archaeon]
MASPGASKSPNSIDWPTVLKCDAESLYLAYSQDLASVSPLLSKINLRLHSISLSTKFALNGSQIIVKASIQPVPGSVVTMRASSSSSMPAVTLSSTTPPIPTNTEDFATRSYFFSNKTVSLGMSQGEVRSRLLKSGEFARLSLQVYYPFPSLSSSECVCVAEAYLPALLRDHSAQPLEMRMLTLCPDLIGGGGIVID